MASRDKMVEFHHPINSGTFLMYNDCYELPTCRMPHVTWKGVSNKTIVQEFDVTNYKTIT